MEFYLKQLTLTKKSKASTEKTFSFKYEQLRRPQAPGNRSTEYQRGLPQNIGKLVEAVFVQY